VNQKQLELQRDLYRLLLGIGTEARIGIDESLSAALKMVIQLTSVRIGYIEIRDSQENKWWSTYHCSEEDIAAIRSRISKGIVAEALRSGKIVFTPSAFLDSRFQNRQSVQEQHIESVLCAPFSDGETKGIIYLQGEAGIEFDKTHSLMETELFARQITPLLRLLKHQVHPVDAGYTFRKKFRLESIVGESKAMLQVMKEAMGIAEIDVTVLITGQTGTGKNLLARTIHENSPRRNKPFVHINCAALPESLVESELFGAVKGAHSSAFYDMKGKIAAADGGTLFLDEIGELPSAVQAKFLQFLEEGYFYPLGSQVLSKANVRVIVASNRDFQASIRKGEFRQDLYYRICVFPLLMPSLRSRREDIVPLSRFFLQRYCEKFKLPILDLSAQTANLLAESEWPGNVRELENQIQQAILRAKAEGSPRILIKHILTEAKPDEGQQGQEDTTTYREGKECWEKLFVEARLKKNDWNVSETAVGLGLSRSQMNAIIRKHRLERPKEKTVA
jgi:Nif-specific regulatory protein